MTNRSPEPLDPSELPPELRRRLEANLPKIMVLNSLWMFLIIMPVIVPFLSSHGLGMEQVFWLKAIFAGGIVLLEVPSGYLADLFGRRRSLLLAGLFHGAAFTVLATAESFASFVVFEILAALGTSFFSGSDVALLYDTQEALGEREGGTHALGRKLLWAQIGETVAAPVGGALAVVGLSWPAVANALVAWLPFLIALSLVEPPRARLGNAHRENFRRLLRVIFRTTPLLRRTFLALVVYGLATLLAVWSFQGYWTSLSVPLWSFGILWAAYNLTVALVGRSAKTWEERWGARRIVSAIMALPIIGYGGMALFAAFSAPPWIGLVGGIASGFAFQVSRGLNQVVIKGALNERVPPELRATANSLSALGVRIFFVLLGPVLGWGFDAGGYAPSFGLAALVYVIAAIAIACPLLRSMRP